MRPLSSFLAACAVFVIVSGCALVQPSTELGALGYKNQGFEKEVHYQGPLAIVLPDNTRLESNNGKLDIINSATATFDAQLQQQQMIWDNVSALITEGMKLVREYMTLQAAQLPDQAVNSPGWKQQLFDELLARIKAETGG